MGSGLLRSFSIVAMAQLITWASTFLFTVAQARYLGPARFGEFSVALSWMLILTVVIDFGLSTKLTRDVAQLPAGAGHAFVVTLFARLGLWCVGMPFVWAATVLLGYGRELQGSILILGLSLLFGGVATTLTAYYQGREAFAYPSLGSIAQRGSAAVFGIGALALGQGVFAVAGAYVVGSLLQILVMLPGLRRHPVPPAAVSRTAVTRTIRGTAALGLFWVFGSVYYNLDMVILEQMVPPENVAWYAAAYRLFNASIMVIGFASGTVLFPALSRLSVGPREELRAAMSRAFTVLLVCGVVVATGTVVFADLVIGFVYSEKDYGEAATALRLLAPAIITCYGNGAFFLTLLGMKAERRMLVMSIVLAIANPLANILLIPVFQQNASALLTTVTELVVFVWVLALTPADLRACATPRAVAGVILGAVARDDRRIWAR